MLTCGGEPLAYVVGYQFQGVYEYAETAYVEDFGSLGPGTFLLYSILQELHKYDAPQFFNFGAGAGDLKRLFANRSSFDSAVLLFRRTPANRMRSMTHGAFRSALLLARRLLKGRRSRNSPPDSRASCGPANGVENAGVPSSKGSIS